MLLKRRPIRWKSEHSVKKIRAPSRSRSRSKQRKAHVVIIKPKEVGQFNETKKRVQSIVKPSEIQVTIKDVKPTKTGGMVIRTQTDEEVNKIIEELAKNDKFHTEYEVAKPKQRRPHIIL